ncbi:hypothetical protein F5H01DRAFT_325672 [Linnemannia elongata]|nr:hypothetical protein F5H01DRAFT_325672 [Linnemannia elongata]
MSHCHSFFSLSLFLNKSRAQSTMKFLCVLFLVASVASLVNADYARFKGQIADIFIRYTEVEVGWSDYNTGAWEVMTLACNNGGDINKCTARSDKVWVDMWMEARHVVKTTITHNGVTHAQSWCNGDRMNKYCEYVH